MQHCEQRRDTDPSAHQDNGLRTRCERERSSRRTHLQDIPSLNMLMQESTRGPALVLDGDCICCGGSGPAERIVSGGGGRVRVRAQSDNGVLSWKRSWQRRTIEWCAV